jgi:hypothetical protein
MDVILFRTFSHVIIMMQKVVTCVEKGAGILIKESSSKVIDAHRDSGKAQPIHLTISQFLQLLTYSYSV